MYTSVFPWPDTRGTVLPHPEKEKSPPSPNLGRKASLPRYHPHSRITRTQGPVTAGTPSCSHRPLPVEQGTHTKAAHSRRPPLSGGGQAPYFPVPHICAVTFYNTKMVEMQGGSDYNLTQIAPKGRAFDVCRFSLVRKAGWENSLAGERKIAVCLNLPQPPR